jgi:hypothetical protein
MNVDGGSFAFRRNYRTKSNQSQRSDFLAQCVPGEMSKHLSAS